MHCSGTGTVSMGAPRTIVVASLLLIVFLPSPCSPSALPSAPTRLFASEVTASSVKLSWDSTNREPVRFYIIQYKPKNDDAADYTEKRNIVQTVYTVTHLKAFTEYEFRVVAVNNIGRGSSSDPISFTTGELGLYSCLTPVLFPLLFAFGFAWCSSFCFGLLVQ